MNEVLFLLSCAISKSVLLGNTGKHLYIFIVHEAHNIINTLICLLLYYYCYLFAKLLFTENDIEKKHCLIDNVLDPLNVLFFLYCFFEEIKPAISMFVPLKLSLN